MVQDLFTNKWTATLDVKLKAPNGANVNVKGKQGFDGSTTASVSAIVTKAPRTTNDDQVEGKYALKPQGRPTANFLQFNRLFLPLSVSSRQQLYLMLFSSPNSPLSEAEKPEKPLHIDYTNWRHNIYLIYRKPGITVTQGWTTAALLDTKLEFANFMSQPVKVELQNLWNPNNPSKASQKANFTFKQSNVHARAFLDHAAGGNISALVDAVVGHEGFVVGAEAGYDIQKAAITRYSAAAGYVAPTFTASILGLQNLSVVAASYYQKVNSNVEAGAKATYDLQGGKNVGLELASKYKLYPLSFAKVRHLWHSNSCTRY